MPALPGAPAAHLRVYEPLAAFPEEEQQRFTALRRSGPSPSRAVSDREERSSALRAAVRRTLDLPDGPALMETVDGLLYICPLRTRLRALIAAGEFRAGMAPAVADAFLPPVLADQAESDLERWRRRAALIGATNLMERSPAPVTSTRSLASNGTNQGSGTR